jgi:glycosyltransferase involved in cell wall biosynthesis
MKKTIWIVNKHMRPPEYETHLRYLKYAQYLTESGFDVKLICSSFIHQLNINLLEKNKNIEEKMFDGYNYILVNTLEYKRNGLKRIFSLFQFTLKVVQFAKKQSKPDIIIHTSNTPFSNKLCSFSKKNHIKYIVEILDLWPESFVSFGFLNKKNPLIKIANKLEKWLYANADLIVFSMEGGKDYIIEKKWDKQYNRGPVDLNKILYINNSVEIMDFEVKRQKYHFNDNDMDDTNFFNVLYIGSISLANDLKMLIDAAEYLSDYKTIRFLIFGDGEHRNRLEEYCNEKKIGNVIFKDKRIEYKYLPSLLSKSSLNILNFKQSPILRFGGSQGKLFNYLAAAKPICSNVKQGYCLINRHHLGIAENFSTSEDYANAILQLSNLSSVDYESICKRTYDVALEYDFRLQAKKLMDIVNQG